MQRTRYRVIVKADDIKFLLENLPETMEDLGNGRIASYLTNGQYESQMAYLNAPWRCPITKVCGEFDDDWYETNIPKNDGNSNTI
jgi:hypothetical protein